MSKIEVKPNEDLDSALRSFKRRFPKARIQQEIL
ncbi:MAG: 30S ribosomal protein S21, partial [Lachnospiraceae bacterium]|nr:30S ribosomal protein S21 [Lachnospiraceae bacterium]